MIDTVDLSSIDKFLEATGNYYRVFQIVLRGGMGNFDGGGLFIRWWEPEEWFWPFDPFSEQKTTFCKYLTLIKIKISMTVCTKSMKLK